MEFPTEQKLIDAERDLNDLETLVNGDDSTTVTTRTGGDKPSVSKAVADAVGAGLLGAGAGLIIPTVTAYIIGGTPPGGDAALCTIPELAAGRYLVRLNVIGHSGNTNGGDIALGFRFPAAGVKSACINMTVYNGTNSVPLGQSARRSGSISIINDCIVTPITIPAPSGAAYSFSIAGQSVLDLDSALQPQLIAYLVSGGAASSDFSPSLREGGLEIIQIS